MRSYVLAAILVLVGCSSTVISGPQECVGMTDGEGVTDECNLGEDEGAAPLSVRVDDEPVITVTPA